MSNVLLPGKGFNSSRKPGKVEKVLGAEADTAGAGAGADVTTGAAAKATGVAGGDGGGGSSGSKGRVRTFLPSKRVDFRRFQQLFSEFGKPKLDPLALRLVGILLLLCILCSAKKEKDNHKRMGDDTKEWFADKIDSTKAVVIMSQGRSGSTLMCNLIGNLFGLESNELNSELLGGGTPGMRRNPDPLRQMLEYLAAQQKKSAQGWAGFKWKPIFYDEKYASALQWLGDHGVKVVYNFRNPLDVLLSADKHSEEPHLRNHCARDDSKCQAQYSDVQLTLPTGERLLQQLDDKVHMRDTDLARFAEFHIPFLSVEYADTAEGSAESRLKGLQRIADFLGVDRELTPSDLQVATVSTAPQSQRDQLTNYDEVVRTLTGTRYEGLLH
ncbi:hypothetical protein B484DRAFT_414349 [Ochromonadaceae sp. CCMP2298]|nr:hypothetical protein B484DRAFT_414349 [Ochromonadaceae sp. CCMP2298]